MKELMGKYMIKEMAEFLKISRQGFYRWRKKGYGKRYHEDVRLRGKIRELFHASKQTYGALRISKDLQDEGVNCGKYRTLRLMKEAGLTPKAKRKFKATTDSKHSKGVAPNLLEQKFIADAPDKVWAADITCVPTREGWLYLAVILDMYSRKIVGWAMSKRIKKELVISAFQMAARSRTPQPGLIFHSDRGLAVLQ